MSKVYLKDLKDIIDLDKLNFRPNHGEISFADNATLDDANKIIPKLTFESVNESDFRWGGGDNASWMGVDFRLMLMAADSGLDMNDPHLEVIIEVF